MSAPFLSPPGVRFRVHHLDRVLGQHPLWLPARLPALYAVLTPRRRALSGLPGRIPASKDAFRCFLTPISMLSE
jgi:hypothetical protein